MSHHNLQEHLQTDCLAGDDDDDLFLKERNYYPCFCYHYRIQLFALTNLKYCKQYCCLIVVKVPRFNYPMPLMIILIINLLHHLHDILRINYNVLLFVSFLPEYHLLLHILLLLVSSCFLMQLNPRLHHHYFHIQHPHIPLDTSLLLTFLAPNHFLLTRALLIPLPSTPILLPDSISTLTPIFPLNLPTLPILLPLHPYHLF